MPIRLFLFAVYDRFEIEKPSAKYSSGRVFFACSTPVKPLLPVEPTIQFQNGDSY